jgi:hypothetical protein
MGVEHDSRGAESTGMAEMRRQFEDAGLGMPPVPAALRPALRRLGKMAYATRDINPMEMYYAASLPNQVGSDAVEDCMAVCHAGHGVNSYAITYHLVYGPVGIFVQYGWGGVYMNAAERTAVVRAQLRLCAELVELVEAPGDARPRGRPGRRLLIVESDFRGTSLCAWLDQRTGEMAIVHDSQPGFGTRPDALPIAIDLLRG